MIYNTDIKFTLTFTVKKVHEKLSNGSYPFELKVNSFEGYPKKTGFPKEMHAYGKFPVINVGDTYRSQVKFNFNATYGYSFSILGNPEIILPSTDKEVAKCLEKHIKGLGKITSNKIVEILGCSAISMIAKDPQCLDQVDFLRKRQKERIVKYCQENVLYESVLLYIYQHKIPLYMTRYIYEQYGNFSFAVLNDNPYLIYTPGYIPFSYAEKIASNLGMKWDDPKRVLCAIKAAIDNLTDSHGDTCIREDDLIETVERFVKNSKNYDSNRYCFDQQRIFSNSLYEQAIKSLLDTSELIKYEHNTNNKTDVYYYRKNTYIDESFSAEKVVEMIDRKPVISTSLSQIRNYLLSQDFQLDEEQINAIEMAAMNGISILTGGPGTGKTYTMKSIVNVIQTFKPDAKILQVAPTAKAASRMREMTGLDSDTIHSAFKIGYKKRFDKESKIETDLVIVDEASMIGTSLFADMLRRISDHTCLLIVGDSAQLPSVDCGDVLNSLYKSGVVPMTELKNVHRQKNQGELVLNAHRIRSRNTQKINQIRFNNSDFQCIEAETPEEVAEEIIDKVQELVDRGVDLDEILILSPLHNGACGTDMLNERLQFLLNYSEEGDPEYVLDYSMVYHIGDKVMNTQNFKIFDDEGNIRKIKNGDVGYITDITDQSIEVMFNNSDEPVNFTGNRIRFLDLAYAMTIHKSQGSEAKYVIMPCISNWWPDFISSNRLIYTAVTRAKKEFICVGTEYDFIQRCKCGICERKDASNHIENQQSDNRMTLFSELLKKAFDKKNDEKEND